MKLKKINNKFNHFLISKRPENKLVFWNNLGEVILFISSKERISFMRFLNEQLSKISSIRIISIFYVISKDKNFIAYDSKEIIDKETRKNIRVFIKLMFNLKLKIKIHFEFVNFNVANKNSREFDKLKIKEIFNSVMRTKEDIKLPAYNKNVRKEINSMIMKYKTLKSKTTGALGNRKIRIIYRPEK
ncbi:hypothetical protein [Spiroplasma monobiae]|uniref:R3H domain-containing protein n=1 Tax=Spiroplasma monobiae MQ-1 TaxID=1336748 RepID=A0A2K9LVK0_SPISQ|nr:hypothetical protein [Spiroplasma monobiae]AUM63063.1 hypothetical protein SMONO_v1c08140 [Spiroplasma monobiae MQ-1]